MDHSNTDLIAAVRAELARAADPAKAPTMQAYMKSEMPYLGVPLPGVRAACRIVFADHPLASVAEWRDTALSLWRTAQFREERYAALALTGERRYRDYQRPAALPMYEEMIVSGAWWDYVDEVATHRIGPLLARYPETMRPEMRAWSRDDNLWKRRAAILAQVGFKSDTDEELLFACIEPNLGDRDFFIRKAIGWALREYAKTNPDAVGSFVRDHEATLSPLSRREAMKHLRDEGNASGSGAPA